MKTGCFVTYAMEEALYVVSGFDTNPSEVQPDEKMTMTTRQIKRLKFVKILWRMYSMRLNVKHKCLKVLIEREHAFNPLLWRTHLAEMTYPFHDRKLCIWTNIVL